MRSPTLEVLSAHHAGIDIEVREGHRAKLLKVKVQQRPEITRSKRPHLFVKLVKGELGTGYRMMVFWQSSYTDDNKLIIIER